MMDEMMENGLAPYSPFIKEIKELIYRRQYEAMKHVNTELIKLYWEIGAGIDRQQREQGWGKSVVDVLANELRKEFPGVQGFSARNLRLMRNFYLEYSKIPNAPQMAAEIGVQNPYPTAVVIQDTNLQPSVAEIQCPNLPPMVAEISWSKNVVIMQKCKDHLEREFYLKMTKLYGWTKDVLINNIENRVFEKYLTSQTNFDQTIPEKYRLQAKLAVKDDYNFDFIEMGIQHSEAELEVGIVNNIRAFLLEMGGDFSFIGNQYHLDAADDDYYIDLLLYHRRLRCLIAIDLKIGEFQPEYVGKMQFYLAALDEKIKLPEENPSIGIIICKSKNRTRVEYTLRASNRPIGVATYSYYDSLPEDVRAMLPAPEVIAAIVSGLGGSDEEAGAVDWGVVSGRWKST
jgi:predicted nuclease of restriction endonuclease-like (RecB) superfamily